MIDFKDTSLPLEDRQQAFLEDMLMHYTSENRGIKNDTCCYEAGCAIGRYLDSIEDRVFFDNTIGVWSDFANNNPRTPKWLSSLGSYFLVQLQDLHDVQFNWDTFGYTENEGRAQKDLDVIIADLNLNRDSIMAAIKLSRHKRKDE